MSYWYARRGPQHHDIIGPFKTQEEAWAYLMDDRPAPPPYAIVWPMKQRLSDQVVTAPRKERA